MANSVQDIYETTIDLAKKAGKVSGLISTHQYFYDHGVRVADGTGGFPSRQEGGHERVVV